MPNFDPIMEDEKSLFELDQEELLKRRIKFYQDKIKVFKLEIKKTEELLETIGNKKVLSENYRVRVSVPVIIGPSLDFSVTFWKPKVYNFLYENPAKYTSEQILLAIDLDRDYQESEDCKKKAIRTISSSLFQLHESNKIDKHDNEGRRGHKWSIKEPAPFGKGAVIEIDL
jgi:hypothetical protein